MADGMEGAGGGEARAASSPPPLEALGSAAAGYRRTSGGQEDQSARALGAENGHNGLNGHSPQRNGAHSDEGEAQDAPLDFSVRAKCDEIKVHNLNNRLVRNHDSLRALHEHSRQQRVSRDQGQHGGRGEPQAPGTPGRAPREGGGGHHRPHSGHSPAANGQALGQASHQGSLWHPGAIKSEAVSPVTRINGRSPPGSNGDGASQAPGPDFRIGEPQTALPGMLPGTLLHGSTAGLFPFLPAGMLPNAAASGLFSGLGLPAAGIPERPLKRDANGKAQRPFKAYPKEALSLPLPFAALQGLPQMMGLDMAAAQAMVGNPEDMFSHYKDYMQSLQDQLKPPLLAVAPSGPRGGGGMGHHHPQASPPAAPHALSQAANPGTPSRGLPLPQFPQLHQPMTEKRRRTASDSSGHSPPASMASGFVGLPQPSFSAGYPGSMPHSGSSSPSDTSPATTPTLGCMSADHNGGSPGSGSSGGRKRGRILPDNQKDEAYWERRRKNNEAAKRSRDARRAKEDEIAIRAAFLEQENLKLRVEVAALKTETTKLRCMLYNS